MYDTTRRFERDLVFAYEDLVLAVLDQGITTERNKTQNVMADKKLSSSSARPDWTASMEELSNRRFEARTAESLEEIGLPADHSPSPATYQDFLPPTSGSQLTVENADHVALERAAKEGNAKAQLAMEQLKEQTQQHVLGANERAFLAESLALAVNQSSTLEGATNDV